MPDNKSDPSIPKARCLPEKTTAHSHESQSKITQLLAMFASQKVLFAFTVLILCMIRAIADEEATELQILADVTEYEFQTESFTASGDVHVRYGDIVITANSVTGNVRSGDVTADGNVVFRQGERTLEGRSFSYNFITGAAGAQDASGSADGIYFRGKRLTSEGARYVLTQSRFTTCDRQNPHYYLSAKELTILPGQRLTARNAEIFLFGTRIIRIPKYSIRLGERKRRHFDLPRIGLSSKYGLHAGYRFQLSRGDSTSGTLNVIMSTRQVFQGGLEYRQIAGKPIILNLVYRQPCYGGTATNSLVSRLPEIGYAFVSQDLEGQVYDADAPERVVRQLLRPEQRMNPQRPASYFGQFSAGYFIEEPGHIKSCRLDFRSAAWARPTSLGRNALLSPAITLRQSTYESGQTYTDLGLGLSVMKSLGKDSYASLTYAKHWVGGSTPFQFDAVEIKNELASELRFRMGSWGIGLGGRYDLEQNHFFDYEVSFSKVIHCLEPKLTWRKRFDEISLDINLVGF